MRDELLRINDDEFRVVCEQDIKLGRENPDHRTYLALRRPPVLQRFYRMLSQMQRSVEGQLAASRAEMRSRTARLRAKQRGIETGAFVPDPDDTFDYETEYQEALARHQNWRAGALRFKTGCEERMAEIAGELRQADLEFFADRVKEERNEALVRVTELENAIRVHREHTCGDDCDYPTCIADDELWGLV